jgi:integrase
MEKLDREGYGICPKCKKRMRNRDTSLFRKILKDFLTSKGIHEAQKIGVGRPRGYGQYKDLDAPEEKVNSMLEYIKAKDVEAYIVDQIMWHKGIRVGAVLSSTVENFKVDSDGWAKYRVLEKFGEWKTFLLSPDLVQLLLNSVIGSRIDGKIFSVEINRMATLNREACKSVIPELEKRVIEPSHLLRHLCAQRLKRKLGSERAAAVMQTTLQSFKESYGGDTAEDVEAWERLNA